MRIALLNAHTAYASGVHWKYGEKDYGEYKLSRAINREAKQILSTYNIDSTIIDGSEVMPYKQSLRYKAMAVNDNLPDLAIETHFNAALHNTKSACGFEVLYHKPRGDSKLLAEYIVASALNYLPFKIRRNDGLYPHEGIYLLCQIECPIVIMEVCFLSHPIDRLYLLHPRASEVIAQAIVHGMVNFLSNRERLDGRC